MLTSLSQGVDKCGDQKLWVLKPKQRPNEGFHTAKGNFSCVINVCGFVTTVCATTFTLHIIIS